MTVGSYYGLRIFESSVLELKSGPPHIESLTRGMHHLYAGGSVSPHRVSQSLNQGSTGPELTTKIPPLYPPESGVYSRN